MVIYMKMMKRVYLSIFRNLKRSGLIVLTSFFLGMFIFLSFHANQIINLIEKTVKSKLSPIVLIEESGKGLNDYEFTGDSFIMHYTDEERNEFHDVVESYRDDERVSASENYYRVMKQTDIITNYSSDTFRNWNWSLLGISSTSDIVDRQIKDTEELRGRYFSEEEIEEGKNVIIVFSDPLGIYSPHVELGDVITYTFYNLDGSDPFTLDFEVIGIFDMMKHTETIQGVENEYLDPMNFTYHHELGASICSYAYIPYNSLINISEMMEEQELRRQMNLPEDYARTQKDERIGKIDYIDSYYQLGSVDDLESFIEDLEKSLKDYPDIEISSSMSSYLDVKNATTNLKKLSMIVMAVSLISSFIILSLIIYIYVRNRKNEVGLYLALGEKKSTLIVQTVVEVLLVCLIGFGASFIVGRATSDIITNQLIRSEEAFEAYDEEVMQEVKRGDTMNQYMVIVSMMELGVLVVSSTYPIYRMMKSDPKESLM